MVGAKLLLTANLAFVFLSAKTSGVYGFAESCPKGGIVDLTEETPDSSGSVNKSGVIFPRNSMWLINGKTFSCICYFKSCVPLCCPVGFAASVDGCVADEFTTLGYDGFESINVDVFSIGNPCECTLEDFASQTIDIHDVSENAFDGLDVINQLYNLEDFCLFRQPNMTNFTAFMCEADAAVSLSYKIRDVWILFCNSVAILFMLATFIVYSVIPERNNLQRWMILSYLASYIGSTVILTIDHVHIVRYQINMTKNVSIALEFVANFCGFSYIMWLDVMSYDIWKKFRTIRSSRQVPVRKRQWAAYFRYSISVWGSSIVNAIVDLLWFDLPIDSYNTSEWKSMKIYSSGVPGVIVFLCNGCFHAMTAVKVKQWKKETAHMVGGVNEHHQEIRQWLNLNLKLFVLSGCPMILWTVAYYWDNDIFELFVIFTEAMQGLFIFLIFVWKDDVKGKVKCCAS